MAKTKTKESKAVATPAVKNAGVTKSAQTPKAKSKELAKSAAKKVVKEKDSKKSKKVVEPESSDESEEDSDDSEESDAADSSDDSDSSEEETVKKPVANGKAKAAAAPAESSDSDSESDSDSASDSEEEEVKPKANGAKVNGKTNGAPKAAAAETSDSSESSDSDEESDDEKPAGAKVAAKDSDSEEDSDDSDDSDDSSDSDAEAAAAPSKKRKAEDEIDSTPKKSKNESNPEGASNLFCGSLSWNIDDDALWEAFKDFEGLVGARVVTDKMTGRSRGFGYVDFSDADAATKAYDAMQGTELDGRALNLDYAIPRTTDANPAARAADRAKKHGDSVSPESDTLFVGNLPFDVDQEVVREFFSSAAEPTSIRLPTDPDTGNLKGFGYVSFGSIEEAKAVFEEKNGGEIGAGRMTRSVRLDFASARPPPREGGGFGGGGGGFGGRGGGRGRGGDRGRGGGRGGGRGRGGDRGGRGGRGGFNRGASSFAGTKVSFD